MRRRRVLFACHVAWVFAALPVLPATAASGIVGANPPPTVTVVRTQQEAKEALGKSLPPAGGRLLLVSPHDYLSSMLLPLRRSGTLTDLTVVLPSDNSLRTENLVESRDFLGKAGVGEEDRNSLRLDNGVIRGTLERIPFTLSTLTHLPAQDKVVLVALDTALFPAVYRNDVKTPMLELAWKLVLTLREKSVRAESIVIFDAVGRPDFPLEYGFLAPLLQEMISRPDAFAGGPPEKWRTLQAADAAFFFSQYADGMELYREYLGEEPGDASACYKIAVMASRDLDPEMALHWLNRAAEIDPLYRRAYSEMAGYFFRKDLFDASERILRAGLSKFPKDPLLATNLAALYLARGEGMREAGNAEAAVGFYGLAAGVEGADPSFRDRARSMLPAADTAPK